MMAAIMVCGASVFASCGNEDAPVSGGDEPVIENLAEKVIGKWIVAEKDGEPALTNQKLIIDFESAAKTRNQVICNVKGASEPLGCPFFSV